MAQSYAEWHQRASEADRESGAESARAEDESPNFDASALRQCIRELNALKDRGDVPALEARLHEELRRHLNDLYAPELYEVALAGPQHVVTDFLDCVCACLDWLADHEGIPLVERKKRFTAAWTIYGRSALMLSGGATWGFAHLGVVKALFAQGLLPDILSGASTGAMVAAGACTRDDDELAAMFADTDSIRLDGLLPVGLRRARKQGAVLDPAQLYDVLLNNVGDYTFAEAHARSGRSLNIQVSPTRHRQKPRLLTHMTAPEVLVPSAALASSALPGLFPPQVLRMRKQGDERDWVAGELWVDGSLTGDLPKLRLSRLHNANHFIVSQCNPHALPFVRHHGRRGLRPALAGLAGATVRAQGSLMADITRRAARGRMRQLADQAFTLASQDYRGDIDLHPPLSPRLLSRVCVNPTRQDLTEFILAGERAVWPRMEMIRCQTRVGRTLQGCVTRLG
jgi:TAG lipase / steryl ester hydrolase / phospholipase A2 / LPA acyltransferase